MDVVPDGPCALPDRVFKHVQQEATKSGRYDDANEHDDFDLVVGEAEEEDAQASCINGFIKRDRSLSEPVDFALFSSGVGTMCWEEQEDECYDFHHAAYNNSVETTAREESIMYIHKKSEEKSGAA